MAYVPTIWENDPSTETPINADNLNHMEQGISDAHEALDNKVDKVDGKGLSTNDYTTEEKEKVSEANTKATSAKTEVENVRIGADGTVYQSAGDSVRNQIGNLQSALTQTQDYVESNIGSTHNFETVESAGFTKTWSSNLKKDTQYKMKLTTPNELQGDFLLYINGSTSYTAYRANVEYTITFENDVTEIKIYCGSALVTVSGTFVLSFVSQGSVHDDIEECMADISEIKEEESVIIPLNQTQDYVESKIGLKHEYSVYKNAVGTSFTQTFKSNLNSGMTYKMRLDTPNEQGADFLLYINGSTSYTAYRANYDWDNITFNEKITEVKIYCGSGLNTVAGTYKLTFSCEGSIQEELDGINEDIDELKNSEGVLYGKTAITFGDSITWYDGHEYSWGKQEGETCIGYQTWMRRNGMTVTNAGHSGARMIDIRNDILNTNVSSYDFITITGGTNDARYGTEVGEIEPIGTVHTTTFIACMQWAIEYILRNNPTARILLMTPPQGQIYAPRGYAYERETDGEVEPKYAEAIKAVGAFYGCPVCDWYGESGINKLTITPYINDPDPDKTATPNPNDLYSIHPNDAGYVRMSSILLSNLRKMQLNTNVE